jgi:hypothetical protein
VHENKDIAPNSIAPNPLGLTPILLFVILVVVTGITTNDITAMPILVAFFISAGYGRKGKRSASLKKYKPFAKAVAIKTLFFWCLFSC